MRDNRSQWLDPKSAANQVITLSCACTCTRNPGPAPALSKCNFIERESLTGVRTAVRRISLSSSDPPQNSAVRSGLDEFHPVANRFSVDRGLPAAGPHGAADMEPAHPA